MKRTVESLHSGDERKNPLGNGDVHYYIQVFFFSSFFDLFKDSFGFGSILL